MDGGLFCGSSCLSFVDVFVTRVTPSWLSTCLDPSIIVAICKDVSGKDKKEK